MPVSYLARRTNTTNKAEDRKGKEGVTRASNRKPLPKRGPTNDLLTVRVATVRTQMLFPRY